MQRRLMMSVAVLAATAGAMSTSLASDYGGVVLGRPAGADGALLVTPLSIGLPGRSSYVTGNPLLAPGPDFRFGPRGRPVPGYGGIHYGAVSGMFYEIPIQDRLYCPESRAYYPAVQECATPWLRMRPGGGVSADSPIPMPGGQHYSR